MVVYSWGTSVYYWLSCTVLVLVFLWVPSLVEPSSPVILIPGQDGVQRIKIVLGSYFYSPNEIIIQANEPVIIELENESFWTPHNFVIGDPKMNMHHEINVSPGDTVNLQLLLVSPGRYTFYCNNQLLFFPSHRKEGMEGVLEVR